MTGYPPLILFSDTGISRLVNGYPDYVTRVFGHERWKPISDRRERGEITADQARTEYVKLYAEGLEGLGYQTVLDRQITKAGGQPMYFLLFASDHKAGKSIMDNRFDRVRLKVHEQMGQGQLFRNSGAAPPKATRRELAPGEGRGAPAWRHESARSTRVRRISGCDRPIA